MEGAERVWLHWIHISTLSHSQLLRHTLQVSPRFIFSVVLVCAGGAAYWLTQEAPKQSQGVVDEAPSQLLVDGGVDSDRDAVVAELVRTPAMTVVLHTPPQTYYLGEIPRDVADVEFAQRVLFLSDGSATYDPWLSRAARELAFQGAVLGDSPSQEVLGFILASSGAPEMSVAQTVVLAHGGNSKDMDSAIQSALKHAPSGPGELRIGVGEAATEGGSFDRRLVVVAARRDFWLRPTPRLAKAGSLWRVEGQAPRGFSDAHASVLYPDNRIEVFAVEMHGQSFEVEVPVGDSPGTVRLSIDGKGNEGPGKLLQLSVEVGETLQTEIQRHEQDAEMFSDRSEAEKYAFDLVNVDRAALGLPALLWDARLSDIARNHSEEMRDEGYFAHLSPTTGLAGDRLREAGYRASAHGENLAYNATLAEAQASLMESVGHRRNLVSEEMSHVGIGLAANQKGTGGSWHLTQLFAKKVLPFDSEEFSVAFVERINAQREQIGEARLEVHEALMEVARDGCDAASLENLEDLPSTVASAASTLAKAKVSVSVNVFYDAENLQPNTASLDSSYTKIALAFRRESEDLHGKTYLVLILSE